MAEKRYTEAELEALIAKPIDQLTEKEIRIGIEYIHQKNRIC